MKTLEVNSANCIAWTNTLNCFAHLSSVHVDFEKFVVPYVCEDRFGLTVKPGTPVNCFPILYAQAVITWAAEHQQKLRLKSVDNKVVFEFVSPQ